jgi:hypothetical protein
MSNLSRKEKPMSIDSVLSQAEREKLVNGRRLAAELEAHREGHRRFIVVRRIPNDASAVRIMLYEVAASVCNERPGLESLEDFDDVVTEGKNAINEAVTQAIAWGAVSLCTETAIDAPY